MVFQQDIRTRTLDLVMGNSFSELAEAANLVRKFLEPRGFRKRTVYVVELLVEEILSNIIKYAHADGKKSPIRLRVRLDHDEVLLIFEDKGAKFNPLSVRSGQGAGSIDGLLDRGFGILITRKMMDEMEYRREQDRNILSVRVYERPPEPGNPDSLFEENRRESGPA